MRQEYNKQNDFANRHYKEPRCHEGNYGMAALLVGARAEERAFAQGRGPNPATMCTGPLPVREKWSTAEPDQFCPSGLVSSGSGSHSPT